MTYCLDVLTRDLVIRLNTSLLVCSKLTPSGAAADDSKMRGYMPSTLRALRRSGRLSSALWTREHLGLEYLDLVMRARQSHVARICGFG